MKKIVRVENLDCANCAAKLERAINKIDGVNEASINFMAMKMSLDFDEAKYAEIAKEIAETAEKGGTGLYIQRPLSYEQK